MKNAGKSIKRKQVSTGRNTWKSHTELGSKLYNKLSKHNYEKLNVKIYTKTTTKEIYGD